MAGKIKKQGENPLKTLADFASRANDSLRGENYKFVFGLISITFLFICISLPIGSAAGLKDHLWLLPATGLSVIVLAFVERILNQRHPRCHRGWQEDRQPCVTIDACWDKRTLAVNSLKSAISNASIKVFICGAALNTIREVLLDDGVVKSIANNISSNPNFELVILFLREPVEHLNHETGRREISTNIASGHKTLRRFNTELMSVLKQMGITFNVSYRVFTEGVLPRHFLLQADSEIYFGSYLSHEEGSQSYLLKTLESTGSRLYSLFQQEIIYLGKASEPFDFK